MDTENIVQFRGRSKAVGSGQEHKRQVVTGKCQRALLEQLRPLIQELFEHADDDMYALANKAATDIVETQYFAAMRELRKLQSTIESTFEGYLKKTFTDFWATSPAIAEPASAEPSDEAIALVDDEELEEQLAVDGLISKAESRFAVELHGIGARFAALAGVEQLEPRQNPLSPYHFVEAFRRSLRQWDSDIGLRLVVYKLFDRHVMRYVGGLYDIVNDIMIEARILPDLKRKIKKNPVAPSVAKSKASGDGPLGAEGGASAEGSATISARADENFDLIGMMLEQQRAEMRYDPYSGYLPRPAGYQSLPEVTEPEFAHALTSLQRVIAEAPPAKTAEIRDKNIEYLTHLAGLLSLDADAQSAKRLAEHDRMLIDVVGMLFDFLLQQKDLPDPVKAVVARLQFPMIKAAKLDFYLFGDKEHPARRLLNNIGHAVFGWNDGNDRNSRLLFDKIESSVMHVVHEFVDDIGVFQSVNEDFEAFLNQQTEFAKKAEARVTQVVRGQDDLLKARRHVAELIETHNRKAGRLPVAIVEFQREAWHDVLMLTLLREGEDSAAWSDHLATLQLLIWSGLPKPTIEDRQKLLKNIPVLLKRIRAGMQQIGFDVNRAGELFEALKPVHRVIISGKGEVPTVATDVDQADAPVDAMPTALITEPVDDSDLPEVGRWLEWEEDGERYRGKLAWRSAITGVCIFVNRNGMKLVEMPSEQLATLLKAGKAVVIPADRKPLMDGLLATMQKALGNG